MDIYYVCVDGGDELFKADSCDNYYDAVIAAIVASKKHWRPAIVISHDGGVVYRVKP